MNRRNYIKFTSATLASMLVNPLSGLGNLQNQNDKIKAKSLKQGAKIGFIAPGTAVVDPDDIFKAEEFAKFFMCDYKFGKFVLNGSGYKSRTINERLDDLHEMFSDKSIDAVVCIRGGYGSGQILDKIDYKLIKDNPKIFIGYSDITALHLAFHKMTGLVSFHGPVALSAFGNYTLNNFQKVIFEKNDNLILQNPTGTSGLRSNFPIRSIVPGKSTGTLIGGNLSLITSLLGTEFEIDTKDKILFIEDVGEEPFRIDRMLNQMRLAGKFKDLKGLIWGKCSECINKSNTWDKSVGEICDEYFGKFDFPVLSGLMIGHTNEQLTLPIGVECELNSEAGSLTLLESGVI